MQPEADPERSDGCPGRPAGRGGERPDHCPHSNGPAIPIGANRAQIQALCQPQLCCFCGSGLVLFVGRFDPLESASHGRYVRFQRPTGLVPASVLAGLPKLNDSEVRK